MNEPKPHPKESDHENKMTKKNLKKMKVTTYTNKTHFHFPWLVKRVLTEAFLCWVISYKFFWDACEITHQLERETKTFLIRV